MSEEQKREKVFATANRKPGSKDSLRASHSPVSREHYRNSIILIITSAESAKKLM